MTAFAEARMAGDALVTTSIVVSARDLAMNGSSQIGYVVWAAAVSVVVYVMMMAVNCVEEWERAE
jgi:hypothetical protein